MSKLQSFFDDAIRIHSQRNSAHLGDRSTYIGASDIGSCPRKVVLSKSKPVEHDSKTLLKFARGHIAEDLIASIFKAGGLKFNRQHTAIHPDHPFLLCHIDFLFDTGLRIHIVEVKSTDGIPEVPYSSWVEQLHFQIGLVAKNNPRTEIGGSILAIDLNAGEWREFNGFKPDNLIFNHLVEKGLHIRSSLSGDQPPSTETGILCGYCPYRSDCPALGDASAPLPDEVEVLAREYLAANQVKSRSESTLKRLKGEILSFTGTKFLGATDKLTIRAWDVGGSDMVDDKLLKESYPDIYDQVKKEKAGSTRLEIKPR